MILSGMSCGDILDSVRATSTAHPAVPAGMSKGGNTSLHPAIPGPERGL